MRDLPPGWATDLAVLEHTGSIVEDHGDHLIVRSSERPQYHWGNCVFVTEPGAVDDAARWIETFRQAHPAADWISIGLTRLPDDPGGWAAEHIELESNDVLTTSVLPKQTPLPHGYAVRRLAGADWTQSAALSVAENERTNDYATNGYATFTRGQVDARRSMSERDQAAFFGAFADGQLVAELGIVLCDGTARYQSVLTDVSHRRRGLAAHLLGVAAKWSATHGCTRWVIVTEADNPAGRVYRSVGFAPDAGNVSAYRKPPR
jgi:GNAT superfamily N-acetyltransferase